jgi:hypothetical protein
MRAAFATFVSSPGSLPLPPSSMTPGESCVTTRSFGAALRALRIGGYFRQ